MKAFCDTNVLLDVLTRREPFYADSAQVWTLAEGGAIEGLISVLSFANVFYIVRRLKDRAAAQKAVLLLRDTFTPVPCDAQILHQAIDAGRRDLEDAIQYFSALRSGAACLVTRNPKDFPPDALPVLTPAEFLATHFADQAGTTEEQGT